MPLVARGNGADTVYVLHGKSSNPGCSKAGDFDTDICSTDVLVDGEGAVYVGCAMEAHPNPANVCLPHSPLLSLGSSTVFVNGAGIGRLGDVYTAGHTISVVAQGSVFAG